MSSTESEATRSPRDPRDRAVDADGPRSVQVVNVDVQRAEHRFRSIATRIAVAGTWGLSAFFSIFLGYHSVVRTTTEGSWLLEVVEQHFAATIGIPLSAVSAACIVIILESTSGPIRFEALGFKFSGASGPVVLWLFCFLAMILALKLLWTP